MCRLSCICCLFTLLTTACLPTGGPGPQPSPGIADTPDDDYEFMDAPTQVDEPDDDSGVDSEPPPSPDLDPDVPESLPTTTAVRMELRPIPTGPVDDDVLFSESRIPMTNPGLAVARPIFYDAAENEVLTTWGDIALLHFEVLGSPAATVSMTTLEGDLVWIVGTSSAELEDVRVRVVGEFEDRTLDAEITLVVDPTQAEASLVFAPAHARIGSFAWYRWSQVLRQDGIPTSSASSTMLAGGAFRSAVSPFLKLAGPEGATYVPPAFLESITWEDDATGIEWDVERLVGSDAGVFDIHATFDFGENPVEVSETVEVLAPWVAHELSVVRADYQQTFVTQLAVGECVRLHASLAIGDSSSAFFPQQVAWPFVDPTLDESVATLDWQRSEVCGVSRGETTLHIHADLLQTSPAIEGTHRIVVE